MTEVYGYAFSVLTSLWEESRIKRDRPRGAHTVLCTVAALKKDYSKKTKWNVAGKAFRVTLHFTAGDQ